MLPKMWRSRMPYTRLAENRHKQHPSAQTTQHYCSISLALQQAHPRLAKSAVQNRDALEPCGNIKVKHYPPKHTSKVYLHQEYLSSKSAWAPCNEGLPPQSDMPRARLEHQRHH